MQMWLVKSGETAVESGEKIKKRQKTWRRNSAARMEKIGMTEELIVYVAVCMISYNTTIAKIPKDGSSN
ncbi:unnamed protein product [Brassica oleracea var. botrytis]|uniref:(rape) hypothetical protein n=1 Tax=Brassica napus TaxID=3708 RepID=A0A816JD31_BRANA|nr:unnamed protein product [Brassica napus]